MPHYDAFIIDIWGVIISGTHAYAEVVDCINYLIASNKSIIFLSNTALPEFAIAKKLIALGIHVPPNSIITSGDMVREQFILWNDDVFSQLPKQFYHLHDEEHKNILEDIPVQEVKHLSEAGFILVTAHMTDHLSQHDHLLKTAQDFNLPMICANPDKTAMEDNIIWYCPGFIAEKYEKIGGKVNYYGKPHPLVYDIALNRFKVMGISDKKRILMIGDTLETDILGAINAGIDSALVMTGNTGRLLKAGTPLKQIIVDSGLKPTWAITSCALSASLFA